MRNNFDKECLCVLDLIVHRKCAAGVGYEEKKQSRRPKGQKKRNMSNVMCHAAKALSGHW